MQLCTSAWCCHVRQTRAGNEGGSTHRRYSLAVFVLSSAAESSDKYRFRGQSFGAARLRGVLSQLRQSLIYILPDRPVKPAINMSTSVNLKSRDEAPLFIYDDDQLVDWPDVADACSSVLLARFGAGTSRNSNSELLSALVAIGGLSLLRFSNVGMVELVGVVSPGAGKALHGRACSMHSEYRRLVPSVPYILVEGSLSCHRALSSYCSYCSQNVGHRSLWIRHLSRIPTLSKTTGPRWLV